MSQTLPELRLKASNLVRDLLTDLANDGEVEVNLEELRDYFGRVSDMIFEELGLELVSVDGSGVVQATLTPPDGWV